MTESLRALLFDVDGTLVDTNYLHAVCWWEAFAQAGHDVPMGRIHRAIGMGSDQMLDALLPEDRDRDEDGSIRAAHSALYATYWTRQRPLPGAADLLRECHQRGWQVVLASSADADEFEALRAALDADDAIDDATSSAEVEQSKPAPDLVQGRGGVRGPAERRHRPGRAGRGGRSRNLRRAGRAAGRPARRAAGPGAGPREYRLIRTRYGYGDE